MISWLSPYVHYAKDAVNEFIQQAEGANPNPMYLVSLNSDGSVILKFTYSLMERKTYTLNIDLYVDGNEKPLTVQQFQRKPKTAQETDWHQNVYGAWDATYFLKKSPTGTIGEDIKHIKGFIRQAVPYISKRIKSFKLSIENIKKDLEIIYNDTKAAYMIVEACNGNPFPSAEHTDTKTYLTFISVKLNQAEHRTKIDMTNSAPLGIRGNWYGDERMQYFKADAPIDPNVRWWCSPFIGRGVIDGLNKVFNEAVRELGFKQVTPSLGAK
jgi:hypothetical protein